MNATRRISVTIRLDASEQFKWKTQTGPIWCERFSFGEDDFKPRDNGARTVLVSGTAIKKDGTAALFHRQDYIPFHEVPPNILRRAVAEFNRNPGVKL